MNTGMLTSVLDRSRSGIRFEVAAPPMPEVMPRMDVAAFIGFAERGPLHCPVAIEDMSQYEKVFGLTPKLGWAENGEQISGLLAESVNSFFIQGGRRCWVVRVAAASASSKQFVLPNLFKVTPSTGRFLISPALAQARSEGSWSDPLHVATRLKTRPVIVDSIRLFGSEKTWQLRTRSDIVRKGDLLRIVRTAGPDQLHAFFPVTRIERDALTGENVLSAQQAIAFKNSPEQQIGINEPSAWLEGKAALVSIDLRVECQKIQRENNQKAKEWRKENLGLTPLHPRYCGALQTDLEIYRGDISRSGSSQQMSSGASVDSAPWFPLAAWHSDNGELESASFMVPYGMDGRFAEAEIEKANSFSELERDGLTNFHAGLFLDQALRDAKIADLMETANAIRYSAAVPRPLTGMHAVLGWFNTSLQDEVALIAVPDAVHVPWQSRPKALRYVFTVAEIQSEKNTKKPKPFIGCKELPAPSNLTASAATSNGTAATPSVTSVRLSWTMPESFNNAAIEYQVQESASENFLLVDQTWQTRESNLDIALTAPGRRIFRVRTMTAAQTSVWSTAIALNIVETDVSSPQSRAVGEVAREIQRELIKLCAAQGELFAVLSLPKKMTELEAANHVLSLSVTSFNDTSANTVYVDPEGRVGSYAAIYHPWIETRGSSGGVNPLPPDGAILGMIAARTHDRGAWIAPANRVLKGVVALHTTLQDAQQTQLAVTGVNLVLQRPEGYTLLSEDTLSSNPDLRPIHVRRLLILMRRIMLRLGEEFTFETNSLALRALIRLRCYNMLARMNQAGAFAGRSAAESFQVSIEDNDNPQASIDAGRLIIRIRIRPAQALRFITIRFELGGGATGITEESVA